MRRLLLLLAIAATTTPSVAKSGWFRLPKLDGMYIQWGYNRDWYSHSDLHFNKPGAYSFTVHGAHATDQPDYQAFFSHPKDITIPQNSYRIGFYLNKAHSRTIELSFDHAKYVVYDNQNLLVTGNINGEDINKDTVVVRNFMHFEHTNGANFYHFNYGEQHILLQGKAHPALTYLTKLGFGFVMPRSDVTLLGHRLDNKFHIAGYIADAEVGMRYYPWKHFFLELNVQGGFANYLNVLTVEGGAAHHHFWYGEAIALFGFDINFHKHPRPATETNMKG